LLGALVSWMCRFCSSPAKLFSVYLKAAAALPWKSLPVVLMASAQPWMVGIQPVSQVSMSCSSCAPASKLHTLVVSFWFGDHTSGVRMFCGWLLNRLSGEPSSNWLQSRFTPTVVL
jgi:hypothetical protein